MGGSGRGIQGPWLPIKLEPFKVPEISHAGISSPSHLLYRSDEKGDLNGECQDAVFLGGILSLYGKTREGSVILSRTQIKGINIDTWA
ncbi:MAG TPA: hypothetical protein PLR20_03225 [Syntrophales bacterium]|nr:hypothetical protein [Syntrophales bacterium]HOX95429.1 hypothetical protein [Syntrophales bacterium]HPI56042.1 hypothetical protein [Syntrophales bacterium]HPN24068.1 hypothetical protein [Syntrophales bacterium]HQM28347.1 hypothetical protein [Syntrophales bacterium]